jgi:hypothetical protein
MASKKLRLWGVVDSLLTFPDVAIKNIICMDLGRMCPEFRNRYP